MSDSRFIVQDDPVSSRYVLLDTQETDGSASEATRIGLIDYVDAGEAGEERVLFHTEVSSLFSGQGLAGDLAQFAVADILSQNKKIVPVCPFVVSWLGKNPQPEGSVVQPQPEHGAAIKALLESHSR